MTAAPNWTDREMRRQVDRCEQCGRFVGHYPVGFFCDTHCRDCTCRRCEPKPTSWSVR